jgi:nucleoside-diphosphate-sugar epimerase
MKLLVLGGTRFVGRAIVADALARGFDVTVISRGDSGEPQPGATWFKADRMVANSLQPLTSTAWDAVIDTWDGAAAVVADSTALLAGSANWYGYVSSRSVYSWPMAIGSDESAPVVDPASETGYAADKRGAELAVLDRFDGRFLLARAGLIVGPHEDTGRLTWWLQRTAAGGWLVAPEPAELVWQLIDARDLAVFMLDAAADRASGIYNLVCPRSDAVTTRRLVDACVSVTGDVAEPRWVPVERLSRAGVAAWDDLPGWIPPGDEAAGMHDCDVSAAVAAGLTCRPIEETVADTWAWQHTLPPRSRRPIRPGLPKRGLSAEQEQAIWWLTR